VTEAPRHTTKLKRALDMEEVPKEKWHQILRRVVYGLALCGLAWYGTERQWNVWVTGALWAGGGFNISRQLANQTKKWILDLGKSVIGLVIMQKNGKDGPDA
jgi:hypothetical protein